MEKVNLVLPKKETLKENAREDFVGVVVWFKYPCDCPLCQKGAQKFGDRMQAHIVIKPIDEEAKLQHSWYAGSTVWSSMGAFVLALNDVLGFYPKSEDVEEAWKEVAEYLKGPRAFKFTSMKPIDFTQTILNEEPPRNLPKGVYNAKEQWFPIAEFSPEDIKKLYNVDIDEVQAIGTAEVQEMFDKMKQDEKVEEFLNEE